MNSESAQKGFKTFILTLSISLLIFSAVYYVLTTQQTDEPLALNAESEGTLAMSDDIASPESEGEPSVFGDLVEKDVLAAVPSTESSVLAASDTLLADTSSPVTSTPATKPLSSDVSQSTSSVPETGVFGVTSGLFLSLCLFLGALFYISSNPRKLALASFEKSITKKL